MSLFKGKVNYPLSQGEEIPIVTGIIRDRILNAAQIRFMKKFFDRIKIKPNGRGYLMHLLYPDDMREPAEIRDSLGYNGYPHWDIGDVVQALIQLQSGTEGYGPLYSSDKGKTLEFRLRTKKDKDLFWSYLEQFQLEGNHQTKIYDLK